MGIFGQNPIAPMGMQAMDPRSMQQQDPRIGQAMKGPGFFGAGGQGRNLIGIIGDALAAAGGGRPYYGPAMLQQRQQDRQDEREDQRWQQRQTAEEAARAKRRQFMSLGGGGIAEASEEGGVNILREPTADVPEWQTYANTFGQPGTPEWTAAARDYVLRGNGPTALAGRTDLKQVAPGKAPSMGGGGPSITPTSRAKYIAEAEEAISRGAPRDAVYARLQKMGVQ